ncbi:sensor histidine kinase [Rhizohabitans arisaemae]|uniref:sensor histidine kinase n=1 Tax=Rhizohabitans arisaemae TaxID=2720610 RepID=UPI0024B121CD|nr:histidine kinase [Rhizohabitans arisaemae]
MARVSWVDGAIAAVVTVAMVGAALVPNVQPWWVVALTLLASAPILWRRAALIPVGCVVGTATTLLALSYRSLQQDMVLLFLPYGALVWTYTFAAATVGRVLRTFGIAVQAVFVVVSLAVPGETLDTFRYVVTAFVASYALGLSTRARRAQRAAEQEKARRLEEERNAAITAERTRIARDMHDIVTHSVGLIIVQAEAGSTIVHRDPGRAAEVFDTVAATGRVAVGQLRLILGALREPLPRQRDTAQPGMAAIGDLVRHSGVAATLEEYGVRRDLPPSTAVAAYRIVQESLTNALRHASGAVRVRLDWAGTTLTVQIAGPGGRTGSYREGHGILGMRERVAACGGTLAIDPRGFTVTATFPIG